MSDEEIQEANTSVDNFLEDANKTDIGEGATKDNTCLIEESDDDTDDDDETSISLM